MPGPRDSATSSYIDSKEQHDGAMASMQAHFDRLKARYGGKAKLTELVKQLGDEGNPMAQVGYRKWLTVDMADHAQP